MKKLIDIELPDGKKLIKFAEEQKKILEEEISKAVERSTYKGIRWVMEDTPVDTGRLKSSIAGQYFPDTSVEGDPKEIAKGKKESLTKIERFQATIGTKVEYAKHVEYGHKPPKGKLTNKQRRFLFFKGILENKDGKVVYSYRPKVKKQGMFRKNIPRIQKYFNEQAKKAVDKALKEGGKI